MRLKEKELQKMNNEEAIELLKILASSYFDFTKYHGQCLDLVEKFDESFEYYDFEGWLTGENESAVIALNELDCASDALLDLSTEVGSKFWALFKFVANNKKEVFISEFNFDPDNINLEEIEEFVERNGLLFEADNTYAIEDNYNNIKDIIKFTYDRVVSEKYKYTERPFLNDNFIVLKIMSDNQTIIKGKRYVPLAQKDIADIADFGLNKVQGIVSMLIKWGYVETTELKGRYVITKAGGDVLDALMKVPTTKIIE